jgi:hypothetical protein
MGILNSLGLRRPAPPRFSTEGEFQIAGVTLINPMHERRARATIQVSCGKIAETHLPHREASLCFNE